MREACACGSSIRASTRQVLTWRREHYCPGQPEPDGILQVNGSHIEHGAHGVYDGLEARIGFMRE